MFKEQQVHCIGREHKDILSVRQFVGDIFDAHRYLFSWYKIQNPTMIESIWTDVLHVNTPDLLYCK